jgi:hypothetical protein
MFVYLIKDKEIMSSCRGPVKGNTFMARVIQSVFELRGNPFPGSTAQDVWEVYETLYPGDASLELITLALAKGSRKGTFTRVKFPIEDEDAPFYYAFDKFMMYRNWSNRGYGLPVLMDLNQSGSAYPTVQGPPSFLCPNKGQAFGNFDACPLVNPRAVPLLSTAVQLQFEAKGKAQECCNSTAVVEAAGLT